jgi:lipoate-protein ligase A
MALDETLLLSSPPSAAWLRFYVWDAPAITFGFAQHWRAVEPHVPGGDLSRAARRPTGGGIVRHGRDLTFSAGFPAPPAWNPSRLYAGLHALLLRALGSAGISATLRTIPSATPPLPDSAAGPLQCFASPVPMDLMTSDGREKILGGALRRMGARALYQGTLMLSPSLPDTPALRDALANAWARFLSCPGVVREVVPDADPQLLSKYRSVGWTARR